MYSDHVSSIALKMARAAPEMNSNDSGDPFRLFTYCRLFYYVKYFCNHVFSKDWYKI